MTLLVGWLSVDQRSPASAYFITDSRYSWGSADKFDGGKKVFALKHNPDIFAYCGDVLFPITILSLIEDFDNEGIMFLPTDSSDEKSKKVENLLNYHMCGYPNPQNLKDTRIYHFMRTNQDFHLYAYFVLDEKWICEQQTLDKSSSNASVVAGSGKPEFSQLYEERYQHGSTANTSRNIYQCFIDALQQMNSPQCGGPPQLVGLYRGKYNGINFGIIFKERCYFRGTHVVDVDERHRLIRWYNEEFEICNPTTMKKEENAQRQPNSNRQ